MNLQELIAEVENYLPTYAQAGLVDHLSIKNWMKETVKEFGGNLTEEYQQSIRVEKGRVKLPENYYALKAAVKCEQEGYHKAESKKHAQRSISYLEWTNIHDYYNYLEGKPCLEDGDSSYITETLYFKTPDESYTFYYKQPQILNLVGHVNKKNCDANCPNLTTEGKYDISIDKKGNYMTTTFNDGFIWLWYKGLPCDEYGDLEIPETTNDKLKNYVVYFCIVKTLEMIWLSEDDPNVINKIQYFSKIRDEYFYDSKSESISQGARGWANRLINNNRRETWKFETMFRKL